MCRVAELLQLLHAPLADTLLVAERLNVSPPRLRRWRRWNADSNYSLWCPLWHFTPVPRDPLSHMSFVPRL